MTLRSTATCGLGLVIGLMLSRDSAGKFARTELAEVPVERLVRNLEAAVKNDPKNVEALVNVARVHGMAYSLKTETVKVRKGHEEHGAWFGYMPVVVPYHKVQKTDDEAKEKAAKEHLLLDKSKDRREILALIDRAEHLHALPRPITPIAVPLRDGLRPCDIEDKSTGVAFDADGSGLKRKWTWITKDAGWLVYDPKGKGAITSGLQLFGNVTFWLFWNTGYDALASLDDNGDGVLTGVELSGLAIWHDAHGDGVSIGAK